MRCCKARPLAAGRGVDEYGMKPVGEGGECGRDERDALLPEGWLRVQVKRAIAKDQVLDLQRRETARGDDADKLRGRAVPAFAARPGSRSICRDRNARCGRRRRSK